MNEHKIFFTNNSKLHMIIGDGKSLVFSGTSKECQDYLRNNSLQSSGFSSLSIVAPGETSEVYIYNGDSDE